MRNGTIVPMIFRRAIQRVVNATGYEVVSTQRSNRSDIYADDAFMGLYERCRPFTATSVERMYSLYEAARYVQRSGVPGDIVECGVWKGGSAMLAALTLLEAGDTSRRIFLYDTFTGMSEPTERDVNRFGERAVAKWRRTQRSSHNEWVYAPLDEVRANLLSTGYPDERLIFVQGKVEETIPGVMPGAVGILRLDTDWYESTYHELVHLYPLVSRGGVLILDDYGHWQGARQAADQYFAEHDVPVLRNRIDYTARLVVKTDGF